MHVVGYFGSIFGTVIPTCNLPRLLCSVPKAHLAEGRLLGTLQLPLSAYCFAVSANLFVITVIEQPESNKAFTFVRFPIDPLLPTHTHEKKGVCRCVAAPPVICVVGSVSWRFVCRDVACQDCCCHRCIASELLMCSRSNAAGYFRQSGCRVAHWGVPSL